YCFWIGMQPRQFLVGYQPPAGTPVPTVRVLLQNALAGAALLWLVPYALPASTPLTVRCWIGLTGLGLLSLFARLDLAPLTSRLLTSPVDKQWANPLAATPLGEFWGQRWNRVVSGLLRDVVFFPIARRAGARFALFVVFAYSGLYHEFVSFLTGSGYGG